MVNIPREGLLLLLKLGHAVLKSEEATEAPEITERAQALVSPKVDQQAEPMKAYWQRDIQEQENKNQPFIDLFLKDVGLNRIPDTTEEPVKESHYKYEALSLVYLPDSLKNLDINAVPEVPKAGSGISNSSDNPSIVVGIVVLVVTCIIIVGGLIAALVYKHYVNHNVTSMNFDNPVYRKTTEDQFALEKNGYAPGSKLYPSTVGEEAREPLNTPGTNNFV